MADQFSDRLRTVETQITSHIAACTERNRSSERWKDQTSAQIQTIEAQIASLLASRSQLIGIVVGASAVGSIVGGLLSALIPRLISDG